MNKNMKIMQIYEIEKNYQIHRSRLSGIKANQIVRENASKRSNFISINLYKRKKIENSSFLQKQRMNKIYSDNECLRQKLIKLSLRQNSILRQSRLKNAVQSTSLRQVGLNPRVRTENIKMREKMAKTRSYYCRVDRSHLRRESTLSQIHRKELINLLQKQLGITPNVTFPNVNKDSSQERKFSLPACEKQSAGLSSKTKDNFSLNRSVDEKRV